MTQPPSGPASATPEAPTLASSADWGMQAAAALLSRMLDSADDTLFELSGRTQSDERRKVLEPLRPAGLTAAFRKALDPLQLPPDIQLSCSSCSKASCSPTRARITRGSTHSSRPRA